MNDRIIGEIQAESSSICITEIAKLTWAGGELRIVNNNEGITVGGKEYTPCAFTFTPPSSSGRDGEITIDDTDGNLVYILQQIDKLQIEVSIIDAEDPEYPLDGPVDFDADSFTSSSDGSCSLTLSSRSKLSYGLSKLTYSAKIFPGLFG